MRAMKLDQCHHVVVVVVVIGVGGRVAPCFAVLIESIKKPCHLEVSNSNQHAIPTRSINRLNMFQQGFYCVSDCLW